MIFPQFSDTDDRKAIADYRKEVDTLCASFPPGITAEFVSKNCKMYFRVFFNGMASNLYIDKYKKFVYVEDEVVQPATKAQVIEYFKSNSRFMD